MVHVWCAVTGVALALLAGVGLARGVHATAVGMVGLAAALALGLAAIDRSLVSRVVRGRCLIVGAIGLGGALLIARHHGVAAWFVAATAVVTAAAFAVGVLAIADAEARQRP